MKKTLAALVITSFILSTPQAFAEQNDGPPPEDGMRQGRHFDKEQMKKHQEKMQKQLGLTVEQKEQAKVIREEARKEMEPLMKQKKELRKQSEDVRKKHMRKFEAILTAEQKEKLEKIKSKQKAKHSQERGRKPRNDD